MKPYTYLRAATVDEATTAYAAHAQAHYLGGGTNLVDLMKLGVTTPGTLVDISRLPLDGIEELTDGGLRIGAMVRNSDLAAHPLLRRGWPVVSQALLAGASGQVRNAATTGGNLLQRTRCPYFQDVSKPCNKRTPGSGCAALDALHRDHAVLGHSPHCIATYPSDLAVALAAVDATVHLQGADGRRTVPVEEFHRLPGERPERDTVIRPGELITAVTLPSHSAGLPSAYRKVRDRASFAFALASVAGVVDVHDGRIRGAALAFGGLAHRPWRAHRTEQALRDAEPTRTTIEHAVDAELAEARPLRDNAFKVRLARALAHDLLTRLTAAT